MKNKAIKSHFKSDPFTNTPSDCAKKMLSALHSAPLWNSHGETADVIVRWAGQKAARYYPNIPLAQLPIYFGDEEDYYLIILTTVTDSDLRQPRLEQWKKGNAIQQLTLPTAPSWHDAEETILRWINPVVTAPSFSISNI